METLSTAKSHGGTQGVYSHISSACQGTMTFAVFVPPQANGGPCPVLWFLSGLTCTHANVMDKGEYRKMAAEHGIIVVCPDTSPRGDDVTDEADNWQFGKGAGFYLDATQPGYAHYQMYSYITDELPKLIAANFPADMTRQSITGHSMGGHGALTIVLKNPDTYKSCSAFAPICQPSTAEWSTPALTKYLGADQSAWRAYDATLLIADGHRFSPILTDQGSADGFLNWLNPDALAEAAPADMDLTQRMQPGYDHSYYFISSFMDDHIAWHADHLR